MNHIIAEGGESEEIIFADIDLEKIPKARKNLNALSDVRFKILEPDVDE
jgi:predicted amidohydrolase